LFVCCFVEYVCVFILLSYSSCSLSL
jgi:hypothetical protein